MYIDKIQMIIATIYKRIIRGVKFVDSYQHMCVGQSRLLTAKEARKLGNVIVLPEVRRLLKEIKRSATLGYDSICTRDTKCFLSYPDRIFWLDGLFFGTDDYKVACSILRKLGYRVSGKVGEFHTTISW